jgi:hypothetical protein
VWVIFTEIADEEGTLERLKALRRETRRST